MSVFQYYIKCDYFYGTHNVKNFTVGRRYKAKYNIVTGEHFCMDNNNEWLDINNLTGVKFVSVRKWFKIIKPFMKFLGTGDKFCFITSVCGHEFFYDQKIYDVKTHLRPCKGEN